MDLLNIHMIYLFHSIKEDVQQKSDKNVAVFWEVHGCHLSVFLLQFSLCKSDSEKYFIQNNCKN